MKIHKKIVRISLNLLQPGLISIWAMCAKFAKIVKCANVANFDNFTTVCRELSEIGADCADFA